MSISCVARRVGFWSNVMQIEFWWVARIRQAPPATSLSFGELHESDIMQVVLISPINLWEATHVSSLCMILFVSAYKSSYTQVILVLVDYFCLALRLRLLTDYLCEFVQASRICIFIRNFRTYTDILIMDKISKWKTMPWRNTGAFTKWDNGAQSKLIRADNPFAWRW